MGEDKPDLERILHALMSQVVFGRTHLKIAKAIGEADPVVIATAPTFFGLTRDAHLQAAQMYAAKLHDKARDSVTVRSALRLAERVAGKFSNASPSEVRLSVKRGEGQIAGFERTLAAIDKRRNEYLAHLAMRTVLDPSFLNTQAALTIDELDDVFVETGNILNETSQLLQGIVSVLELLDAEDYQMPLRLVAEAKCAQAERYEKEFGQRWPYPRPRICS